MIEVTSWGGAGGGHEAQGRTAEDTWGGGRLVGCRVSFGILGGGRGGFLADGQLSHDSLRPHFSVEAATSLS